MDKNILNRVPRRQRQSRLSIIPYGTAHAPHSRRRALQKNVETSTEQRQVALLTTPTRDPAQLPGRSAQDSGPNPVRATLRPTSDVRGGTRPAVRPARRGRTLL